MLFDPVRDRNGFVRDGGSLIRWYLTKEKAADKPIGNMAAGDLGAMIYASLSGLHEALAPLVPRAVEWLDDAIIGDEQFGESQDLHRQTLHWARALGKWMEAGARSTEDWATAMRFEEASWSWERRPMSPREIVLQRLDDFMAFAVQSGDFQKGIETHERLIGPKKLSLGRLLKPREYGYAVCLRQARGEYDEQDLFEAGRRMLQSKLEETWLGAGQAIRAATWLKIVYWDKDVREGRDPTLTPLQTLLKAYENMPNVAAPDFLQAAKTR